MRRRHDAGASLRGAARSRGTAGSGGTRRSGEARRAAAIVVAAGAGKRLGGKVDKAFSPVGGKPLLFYSLAALESAPDVERTIVVVRRAAVRRCQTLLKRLELRKVEAVVAGGRRRQDSVKNGLRFAGDSEYVLVHDAARPFLSRDLISRTMAACRRTGAAIAAEPASDTVKRVKAGRIIATVPRESLWLAQTPQAFRREFLERAFDRWPDRLDATDDAAMLERAGFKVAVVPGDALNIKVTYPRDIALAETLLKAGKGPVGTRRVRRMWRRSKR